ncbi:MAG: DUF3800 domain-containing protein [Chloroflexi bacterium]|nr:DUF3800 domain-containing protein [Chloroflexota bacterium]
MQIAYYDESGDDGYPKYSSPFFILTALYISYLNWRPAFDTIVEFRRSLKISFGIPIRMELHTKHFLLNKNPDEKLGLSEIDRITVADLFCDLIANLNVKIINVVIVKPRIRNSNYEVLDTALTYSIQRIENDLNPSRNPDQKFMIITDAGRVGKMCHTARKIQRINFIPSKFKPSSYRKEVLSLIEDPLPKDSKESYFIQLADLISFVVYLRSIDITKIGHYPARLPASISPAKIDEWLERLKPALNLQASSKDPFGIVYYPQ